MYGQQGVNYAGEGVGAPAVIHTYKDMLKFEISHLHGWEDGKQARIG